MISLTDAVAGFAGGLLIGLAALIYLLVNGRIMGVSGILGRLFDRSSGNSKREAAAFILGLVGLPLVLSLFTSLPATHASNSVGLLIVAGALVGVGTRLGSGCTSGHGVCGISRLSIRSLVATVTFMVAGIIAVAVLRGMGG